jgi:antitoxin ParD1/3/4
MRRHLTPADLPEDAARFAEAQIAAGRFATVDDVVLAAMRSLETEERRYETKLAALRAAIDEGDQSGIAEDSSLEGVLAEFRAKRGR